MRVHLLSDSEWPDKLRPLLDSGIDLSSGRDIKAPADYEVLIAGVPDEEHLQASDQLTTLVIPWAGLPVKTRRLLQKYPHLQVYNIHHNAAAAAEMAIGLMLAAAKRIVPIDRQLRANDWYPRYHDSEAALLEGKNVLVLGYGAIGRKVARVCRALGMTVKAIGRQPGKKSEDDIELRGLDALDKLLAWADVLQICLPLTSETEGLIGQEQLARLQDGAVLVNIARGDIVDEDALYQELQSGRLVAGIDVWWQYPGDRESQRECAPSKHDLSGFDNVVMTPHLAGHTKQTEERLIAELATLLNQLADGESPATRVDVDRGY